MGIEKNKDMESYSGYTFPKDIPEVVEIDQEVKLEAMEIKPEDIEGIEGAMELNRNKEGISGKQQLAFEGSGLAGLRKEAPELGIQKVEFSDEDIKNCKDRMEKDIEKAEADKAISVQEKWMKEKRKVGRIQTDENTREEKIQLADWIKKEVKSEQVWDREFQTSYLKDVLDKEAFEKSGFEVSSEEWEDMVDDLRTLINEEDWHKVIPRMGHMNNIDPKKFDGVRSLFNTTDKDRMLQHIDELKGNEAIGKKINAWELGSRIRYVAECFPELRSRIELDDKSWKKMNTFLEDARKKGDYWTISYHSRNAKFIENMAKRGEIKIVKANTVETKTGVVE